MKEFENLKRIASSYKEDVDALAVSYRAEVDRDANFRDDIRESRAADRNARFNAEISSKAAAAKEKAATEIAGLREKLHKYITAPGDPAVLQTLQALLSSGVELTKEEIKVFSASGNYAVLRMLEKPSRGTVRPVRVEAYEVALGELTELFNNLSAYRGELASIGPGGYIVKYSTVGNSIMESRVRNFPAKADELAEMWGKLEV